MAFQQGSILKCPFCDKGDVKATIYPRTLHRVKTSWGGSKPGIRINEERVIVQTDCPSCAKSKDEIQRAFKEGVKPKPKSKEEVRKQLEELGLLSRPTEKNEGNL